MDSRFFREALANITRHGDTDVFPFPIENQIFFDKPAESLTLLTEIDVDFETALVDYAPLNQNLLAAVGYTGFRSVTQIEPLWNAYFLALVLSIADDIELQRLPVDKETIFSYRVSWDPGEHTLFRRDLGWPQFQTRSNDLASRFGAVLVCDVAEFYPRIYHHRLENALKRASQNTEAVRRIMLLLKKFSREASYGLPVGGPAARLLSELLLNRVDRLLTTEGITFCRFADDYRLFGTSTEEAYGHLIFLSEKLFENEGLLLQKAKTRVLSAEEFLAAADPPEDTGTTDEVAQRQFLRLRLHFDPYSETAERDYEDLRAQLARFDILGMLSRELSKSRVHQTLARRLIGAVRHLDAPAMNTAVLSLIENLQVLYPVFPTVALLIKDVVTDLTAGVRSKVFEKIRGLVLEHSYVLAVPLNLAYVVHVLAFDASEETISVLSEIHTHSTSPVIRRDVVLAMARLQADYWLSDIKNNFNTQSRWEQLATLVGSFILSDEGSHWRRSIRNQLTPLQRLACEWTAERLTTAGWRVPL